MNQSKTTQSGFIKLLLILPLALALSGNAHALQLKANQPSTDLLSNQDSQNSADTVYNFVDKMPEFPGGEKEVVVFLNNTISFPAEALKKKESGKVIVQFVISNSGKVENAKVLKGVSTSLDKEALRVISLLPDWTPGELNGTKVAVYRIIPIMFQSAPIKDKDAWEINDKTLIVIDGVNMPSNFNTNILNPSKLISATVLKPFPKEEKSRIMAQYGRQAANGVILITSNKNEIYFALADSITATSKDCKSAATMPEFAGGESKLLSYIADSIQYPFVAKQLKTEGKVIVRFTVDKNGKVSDAIIMKSLDYFLDKEALRVITTLPDWTPATQCEQKLSINITLPVIFKLDIPVAEKKWEKNDKTIILLDGERLPATFDLAWLNYGNLTSYKVLEPSTKEINKKLVSEYGRDAVNGVVLIGTK